MNALVVGGAENAGGGRAHLPANEAKLVAYSEAEVLHGPGAFRVLADGYEDYARAMRVKLVRELQAPMMSGWVEGGTRDTQGGA